jgi:heme oxygenase (biliverdin-IX-beta and delta-forming)
MSYAGIGLLLTGAAWYLVVRPAIQILTATRDFMTVFAVDDSVKQLGAALSSAPPATPSSILSRLRLETRSEHEAVEQVLDLMSTSLTRQGYRQRLQQFFGFYAPLEDALQARGNWTADIAGGAQLSPATRSALASRLTKTAHLRQDLGCFDVMTEDLPLCLNLPPLGSQAELLGCLYVLEGATLGGQMITRHVQSTLGITPDAGGSFFEGYGADTGKMWQSMRQLLLSGAPDTLSENTIVANAITTFACLRRWCESGQTPPATAVSAAPDTTRHA